MNPFKYIKYVIGVIGVAGMLGTFYMCGKEIHRNKDRVKAQEIPWADPDTRIFYIDPFVSYIDQKPFGDLDLVVDYTSGKRTERKPDEKDASKFKELEKIALEEGLIHNRQ